MSNDAADTYLRSRRTVPERAWGVGCRAWDLVSRPELRVTSESMPPGTSETPHVHDLARQVFLVTTGRLEIEIAGRVVTAGPGEAIEVGPGKVHQARNAGQVALEFVVVANPTTDGDRRVERAAEAAPTGVARPAGSDDVAGLVRLRGLMFEAMGLATDDRRWEAGAAAVIRAELATGALIGWVVDAPDGDEGPAAGGIAQFAARLPTPGALGLRRAHLSSMSTDPRWRRRGYARAVLVALLADCRARDVDVIELHATDAGRALYESNGFVVRSGGPEMRLVRPQ